MRNKLMFVISILLINLNINLSAANLYSSDYTEIETESVICANDSYYYEANDNGIYEAEIVATDTKMLLSTINSQDGVIEFIFPSNIEKLSLYIYEYTETARTLIDTIEVTISDCGYEQIIDDYSMNTPQTKISLEDNQVIFTKPNLSDYKLYLNEVEADDNGKSRPIIFKEEVGSFEYNQEIIQITEQYTDENNEKQMKFYELDLNTKTIRELTDFELNPIEPLQLIDKKIVSRILIAGIILIILIVLNIILTRQYKVKKRQKKEKKLHEAQLREKKLKIKQMEHEKLMKKYDEELRKIKEREQRDNLRIKR